jgi:hypothetical protein
MKRHYNDIFSNDEDADDYHNEDETEESEPEEYVDSDSETQISDDVDYPFIDFLISQVNSNCNDDEDSDDNMHTDDDESEKEKWQVMKCQFKKYAEIMEMMTSDPLWAKIYSQARKIMKKHKSVKYTLSAAIMRSLVEFKPLIQQRIEDYEPEESEDEEEGDTQSETQDMQIGAGCGRYFRSKLDF